MLWIRQNTQYVLTYKQEYLLCAQCIHLSQFLHLNMRPYTGFYWNRNKAFRGGTLCRWMSGSRRLKLSCCLQLKDQGWVHTCNVTVYRNTVSWQCGRDSWRRNVSKIGYAVTLRACSVCCRYLAVASKGWYGYGRNRCGRATWRGTSTAAQAVTVSPLSCDNQIPTAHRKSP